MDSPQRGLPGGGVPAPGLRGSPSEGPHALDAGGCEEHLNWRAGEAGSGCYYCREEERESARVSERASRREGGREESRSGPAGGEVGREDLDFGTPAIPSSCPLHPPDHAEPRPERP